MLEGMRRAISPALSRSKVDEWGSRGYRDRSYKYIRNYRRYLRRLYSIRSEARSLLEGG